MMREEHFLQSRLNLEHWDDFRMVMIWTRRLVIQSFVGRYGFYDTLLHIMFMRWS